VKRLTLVLAALLLGCSPALNWRDVSVGALTTMLPCKPDMAQRDVQLDTLRAPLLMAGCETDGALFAVSTLPLSVAAQGTHYVELWKAQALQRMQARQGVDWAAPKVPSGLQIIQSTSATGQDPRGAPLQARLVWLQSQDALYHLAIYGPKLDDGALEMFISQVRLTAGAAP
jgi:hypothetical protein